MQFCSEYPLEHTVFLKNRQERLAGIITGIRFEVNFSEIYHISWGDGSCDERYFAELIDEFEVV